MTTNQQETATFGGGCFWCIEAVFDALRGVQSVESGYCGGHLENPRYEDICNGDTGHAEVVNITFDPNIMSYEKLLEVFFNIHDPTTLNAQGNDVGTQYRSVIFYHSPEQQALARQMIANLEMNQIYGRRAIVTEVSPAPHFYIAEPYHQEYFERNPQQSYCQYVVSPKFQKFRKQYAAQLKSSALGA